MKLDVQKDLDLSEVRFNQANNIFNGSRMAEKKKATQKYQEIRRK
jgi:hypothetical protein